MKTFLTCLVWAFAACLSVASASTMAQFGTHTSVKNSAWRSIDVDLHDGVALSDGPYDGAARFAAITSFTVSAPNFTQSALSGNQLSVGLGTEQALRSVRGIGGSAEVAYKQSSADFVLGLAEGNAQALHGKLNLRSNDHAVAPSVPEPQNYAFVLAGLAMTATLARRRVSKPLC